MGPDQNTPNLSFSLFFKPLKKSCLREKPDQTVDHFLTTNDRRRSYCTGEVNTDHGMSLISHAFVVLYVCLMSLG